jgi:hypothetical protein
MDSPGIISDKMILEFDVSREDLLSFIRTFYKSSTTHKKAELRGRLIFPVMMMLGFTYVYFRKGYEPYLFLTIGLVFLAIGAIWFFLYPSLNKRKIEKYLEKYLNEMSIEKTLGHVHLVLDDSGFLSRSPTGEGKYSWDVVQRVTLTPEHLHVYLAGGSGYPIPRKCLEDKMIFEAKKLIESKIPEQKKSNLSVHQN